MSAILGFYISTPITVGKMPLAAGCSHHRMQGMIMIGIPKTGEKYFPLIDFRLKHLVTVHIGVDND